MIIRIKKELEKHNTCDGLLNNSKHSWNIYCVFKKKEVFKSE